MKNLIRPIKKIVMFLVPCLKKVGSVGRFYFFLIFYFFIMNNYIILHNLHVTYKSIGEYSMKKVFILKHFPEPYDGLIPN